LKPSPPSTLVGSRTSFQQHHLPLTQAYGEQAFLAAVTRTQKFRRFDAHAVERILERDYPALDDAPLAPLRGIDPVVLGEVEPGSLDDYSDFDAESDSPQTGHSDDQE
jgi:hypothetical protein